MPIAGSQWKYKGPLYVYLMEEWHIGTWVNGGTLPIKLARAYFGQEREKQMTPDETLIYNANMSMESVERESRGFFNRNMSGSNWLMTGCVDEHGRPIPEIRVYDNRREDVLVLCFSRSLSGHVASKFDRKYCVEVPDIWTLKEALDKQLGEKSDANICRYTLDFQRHHMLKSIQDVWQAEFRLVWQLTEQVQRHLKDGQVFVTLPAGTGRPVEIPASRAATNLDEKIFQWHMIDATNNYRPG